MSRFKSVMKKKRTGKALGNHPLVGADEQLQKDYLQGLVFVAVEDENFSQEEKDYIKLIMQHIDMDESLLETFESFAKDPDEEELMTFMERLQGLDEALRTNFLMEVVLLAFKDGSFDEKEQAIFEDYTEMLGLQDQGKQIRQLAEAIAEQDMDVALAFYAAKKDWLEPLQYLFALADMDVQTTFDELYQWQWLKWDFSDGAVADDSLVATKPVSVRQIAIFMNALLLEGRVEQLPDSQRFEHKDKAGKLVTLVAALAASNLKYEGALFTYEDEDKEKDFVGASTVMPSFFVDWLNVLREENVKHLYIKISFVLGLQSSAQAYLTESPEMVLLNLSYKSIGDKFKDIQGGRGRYESAGNLDGNTAYTFRLMKLEEKNESED